MSKEKPVHLLRLQDPGGEILLPERPEHGGERNWDEQVAENFERLGTANDSNVIAQSDRGNVNEPATAGPKDHRRDEHEDTRNAEGNTRAVDFQQPWDEQSGKGRPKVNGEIEPTEDAGQQMLVGFPKLVSDGGRDARLNAADAASDENQADRQAQAAMINGQCQVPQAVN